MGLSQTLELGKRGPRIASAELLLNSARSSHADALDKKMNEARSALARVVYLREKQTMFEERLQSARGVLEAERVRLKQGYMSGNDFDRLLLDTLVVEAKTARAQAEVEEALQLCGVALFARCELPGAPATDLGSAAPLPNPLPDVEAAISRRPDVQALELAWRAALQDARLAERRAIPDVTLRLGYMEDRLVVAGDQPHTLQVGVSVPLPVFNRGQHEAAKANARARELEHTIAALTRRARAEAQALLRRRAYLTATIARLTSTALPRSRAVLESSLRVVITPPVVDRAGWFEVRLVSERGALLARAGDLVLPGQSAGRRSLELQAVANARAPGGVKAELQLVVDGKLGGRVPVRLE